MPTRCHFEMHLDLKVFEDEDVNLRQVRRDRLYMMGETFSRSRRRGVVTDCPRRVKLSVCHKGGW